ncbi:hypothetical protein CEUSTIGMA_g41.t1 [Chlamydomonas eustigma]|uniref:RNA helicase n=1 Tax=Chlamydomonas eustigma TaxID=1157962 RepID=A0A250WP28_9CHLO|nr:hypothetical protein CEUSTIGMA_g41.t1 [Chlamydomonas eustigma]|eukprot:GAX72585.1 hypothetical protein CEUSTIGMA_g41.t1 [Chlamydomonas eustigma]
MTAFHDLGLDVRLLRAVSKLGFTVPTSVQAACIPKTLEGKDIIARARTGSGKTLAYLLPALHRVLACDADSRASFNVIVLVPTRELCEQVQQEAKAVADVCGSEIKISTLLGDTAPHLRRSVEGAGNVVVTTPGKLATALREALIPLTTLQARLQMLVLDEADLLLSYGYEDDLQLIAPQVPRSCQCMLMSATVSEDVERLHKLILHSPVTLNLFDTDGSGATIGDLASGAGTASEIDHFSFECPHEDKLLITMALLKLGLVRKKVLIFVNTVDRGYQLRLFLESFGVRSALLNAELPLNSRSHILQTFNKGLFDYLIATDDVHAASHDGPSSSGKVSQLPVKRGRDGKPLLGKHALGKKQAAAAARKDEEYGVTRGIDFKGVRTIINYDLPSSVQGYVHRVGRTGWAGQVGVAITLFTPKDQSFRGELFQALTSGPVAGCSHSTTPAESAAVTARVNQQSTATIVAVGQEDSEAEALNKVPLRHYGRLPKLQIEALRYRGEDIARSITRKAIKEARAKELKMELLNSEKLKEYFEEHAAEKTLLRHDKPLHKTVQAAHLKHVPAYLKDPSVITERSWVGAGGVQSVADRARRPGGKNNRERRKGGNLKESGMLGSSKDPLKEVTGFAKAPKRGGGGQEDELTEMEKRAMAAGKKEAKLKAKLSGAPPVPKVNVRKFKRRR